MRAVPSILMILAALTNSEGLAIALQDIKVNYSSLSLKKSFAEGGGTRIREERNMIYTRGRDTEQSSG